MQSKPHSVKTIALRAQKASEAGGGTDAMGAAGLRGEERNFSADFCAS